MSEPAGEAAGDAAAAPAYHEPPRSYASLLVLAGVIALGFGIDLLLGGGVAHVIGWLIALVLVVGTNFLIVYAARSEKSLHIDSDELRVGDEAIPRAEVVAVSDGVETTNLSVLGWPTGKPRSLKMITVRLASGDDLVVPTRFPDRVRGVLGLDALDTTATGQRVRAAARVDLPELADIDRRADAVFRAAGYQLPELPFDGAALERASAIFVAGKPPVGFVWVDEVDGHAHLTALAVIPKWMGQGIGGQLLERACEWAVRHDYPAITLTAYVDVPWNAPFYARRGFRELREVTPQLAAIRAHEAQVGLDAVGRRIVMCRDLT